MKCVNLLIFTRFGMRILVVKSTSPLLVFFEWKRDGNAGNCEGARRTRGNFKCVGFQRVV